MTKHFFCALHQQLYEATRALHSEIDHHSLLQPLFCASLSISEYGDMLAALHGFYAAAETIIEDGLNNHSLPLTYHDRRKLPAIADDLAQLQRYPWPFEQSFPRLSHSAQLIGLLYVVEGASLGGQMIAARLRQQQRHDLPLSFYSGSGENVNQQWQAFLNCAASCCSTDDYETACQYAREVFTVFLKHLDAVHRLGSICLAN